MDRNRSAETILTLSLALLVIYFLQDGELHWLLLTSLGIGVAGLISSGFRHMVHDAWFWLADKVGWVMSRIVLSVVFICVVIPFGFLAKLFRKDIMYMKKGRDTYYKRRNHTFAAKDLEDPW